MQINQSSSLPPNKTLYLHIPESLLSGKWRQIILLRKFNFGLFTFSLSGNSLIGHKIWLEFTNQPKHDLLKKPKNNGN